MLLDGQNEAVYPPDRDHPSKKQEVAYNCYLYRDLDKEKSECITSADGYFLKEFLKKEEE